SEGPLWRIGIEHPRRPEEYAAVFESQEEVALSATEDNADFMKVGQRRIPFVFDPETGSPPAGGGVIGTTVTARHAAVAHALSYAFFVSGPEKSYELAERFKEEGVGAVFFEEGQNDKVLLSASENLRRSLKDIQP
ncbi:MAG: FAD:protein FMN transferase, partial [Candidatus Omnitrophota bacterium]